MAFKVKILSVLLFICLIDSLHSASYRRMRRDTEEEAEAPAETPEKGEDEESSGKTDSPDSESSTKKSWFNLGQLLNVNGSPDWMKDASAWFNNAPNLFGKN